MKTKNMVAILLISVFSLLIWGGLRTYHSIQFNINVGGHLTRASNANTVDLAKKELKQSVDYLKDKGFTDGYTSILYNTPDEDIEFWYGNLSASLEELSAIPPNTSQLEKTNILMKLRETLTDSGKASHTIIPDGLSIYPYNFIYFVWGLLSLLPTLFFGIWLAARKLDI